MNRITNKMRKTLAKIAKSLPACHHKDQTVLVEVGRIDKRTIQVQRQPKEVNHKKNIEAAYEKLGKVGVFQYCESIHQLHKESQTAAAQ